MPCQNADQLNHVCVCGKYSEQQLNLWDNASANNQKYLKGLREDPEEGEDDHLALFEEPSWEEVEDEEHS